MQHLSSILYALATATTLTLVSCGTNRIGESKAINTSVSSPNGKVACTINRTEDGGFTYAVYLLHNQDSIPVIVDSPVDIETVSGPYLAGMTIEGVEQKEISEKYSMLRGKELQLNAEANELRVNFSGDNKKAALVIRAFDDGIAFRYAIPEVASPLILKGERTEFQLPAEARVWIQPYDSVTRYSPGYERYFLDGVATRTESPTGNGWCLPVLVSFAGGFVLVTESGLDSSFFASHLENNDKANGYRVVGPVASEAKGLGTVEVEVSKAWESPWRVMIVGKELSTIVESNLVYHVAPQSKGDFSWVKPGRASWSWWSFQDSPKNADQLKKFIDLSASLGWEYSLVDANWNIMKSGNIDDVLQYAKQKNVGIWLWYNSGGPHNDVTEEPRDIMSDPEKRRAEMKRLQEIGVKGIKVDFFQSDKQFIIKHYLDILRDAADHQIMVNFHGCTIPRGWSRTWPNLLSMESVRGAESYLFASEFPEKAPLHNVQLAFTRNVIGPMDYTPVAFSDNQYPHKTTAAHELALAYVFESGIFHAADKPDEYLKLDPQVKDLLSTLPVVWDETRLLEGHPSSHVVMARRSGDTWYIGGINGKETTQEVKFALPAKGRVLQVGDNGDGSGFIVITPAPADSLSVVIQPNGGFVMRVSE